MKKKEILPYVTMWMDLESILISEIKWSENDKYYMILLNMESNEQINKQKRKKS